MELSQLNAKQRSSLVELREAVKDCQLPDDDHDYLNRYLLKWLTVSNFDPAKAEKSLRATLEWRKIHQIDVIVEKWTPPKVMEKYYSLDFTGYDKYGCPVWVQKFGKTDFRGLMESVTRREYKKYVLYLTEMSLRGIGKMSHQKGKLMTHETLILDMEELSMKQLACKPGMEVQVGITRLLDTHYPDVYRKVFVINAPKIFGAFFSMIKPFMHELTVKKFHIFSSNTDEWKAALLEDIDASQLPIHYGGTMVDRAGENELPNERIVPKSFYRTNKKPQRHDDMKSVVVPKGAKKRIEFDVNEPNSILKYEFFTEEGDIAWRIFVMKGDQKVDVVPEERIECHIMSEKGEICCCQSAIYVVEFNNEFSYLRSKTVQYSISVHEPPQ